ncbi:MAG: alpha-galactosidase [Lentisphaerota bacterium]
MNSGFTVKAEERQGLGKWIASLGLGGTAKTQIGVVALKQGWGSLGMGHSIINEPLCLAGKKYDWGLGTHADSEIVLRCTKPVKTFRVKVGVDHNKDSINGRAEMMFSVWAHGRCISQSQYLNVNSQAETLNVDMDNVTEFTLKVKAKDTISLAHADWAEAEATTADGETLRIGTPGMASIDNSLPLSFKFNGMDSEQWLRKWGIKHTQSAGQDYITHLFICHDQDTGLKCTVELQEYLNSPACLWNVYFTNTGKTATPVLEQVKTLDVNWPCSGRKELYRARGAFDYSTGGKIKGESFRDNFMMVQDNFETPIIMGGVGGRSSVDWMPFFNFQGENTGLMFGIGWTGQWHSEVSSGLDRVRFQAGMENIHTILEPGETIRQPSILMIYWQGADAIRGHNLLRNFIQENLSPRDEHGKTLQAPACNLTWGGMIASSHLARIKNLDAEHIHLDYYWIDAGWYGKAGPNKDEFAPQWASQAGDWSVNHETYPHGFKEISDATHAVGKKFLLWVEPERAIHGTPITLEHPEWFFGAKESGKNVLLNLGNPEARKWCTELISGLIAEQGLDCYRQDFNIGPLSFWQANDTPDRIGISEIRYVEGLYAFLGELRQRFPNLLIDNCASGGRRLDFEMMRYSIPLWASDMQCFPDYITERNQQQVHGLSYWLPQFGFGTQEHPGDTYHFRSTMAAGVAVHLFTYEHFPIKPDYPYQWLRERLAEYHRAKVCFTGDFYPLFDQTDSMKYWTAYQFYRPDLEAGIILAFRKQDSPIQKVCFNLHGLESKVSYELEDADSKAVTTVTGRELMEKGLSIEIEIRRGSRLFFLRTCSKTE